MVVGAPLENASGYQFAGHAYTFNSKTGALIGLFTSPNAQEDGYFGYSVAASGNTVVVGAPFENANGYKYAGHAYIFNATTGATISTLTSPNAQYEGVFGWSVATNGWLVIVGAGETVDGYPVSGRVYTFNASTGALIRTLVSPKKQVGGWFGWSVAVSGNVVIVGAPNQTANGYTAAGHAYTFNPKTGALISTLTSPNVQWDGYFGQSVAASGDFVVVGAPLENASGYQYAGHAYTFDAKTGALISSLTSPNEQYYGEFGASVAASGNLVVVGAPYETANGYYGAGHAYTFNAKTGGLVSTLRSPKEQYVGDFGYSVGVGGKVIIVGAPSENANGHKYAGHAYIF